MPMGARRLPWAKGFPSLSGATLGALWALYNKRKKASFFTFPVAYPASVLANSPASWARRGIARAVPPVLRPVGRLPAFWAEPPLPGLRPRGAKFVAGSLWGSASPPWPEVKGGQIYRSQLCRPSIPLKERQACRATFWAEHALPGWRPMGASLSFAALGAEHPLRNWRPKGDKFAVRNSLGRASPLQLEAAGVCRSQLFGPSTPSPAGRQRAPSLPFATGFAVRGFLDWAGLPSLAGGHGSQVCSSQLFGPGPPSLAGRNDVAKLAVRNVLGRASLAGGHGEAKLAVRNFLDRASPRKGAKFAPAREPNLLFATL